MKEGRDPAFYGVVHFYGFVEMDGFIAVEYIPAEMLVVPEQVAREKQ